MIIKNQKIPIARIKTSRIPVAMSLIRVVAMLLTPVVAMLIRAVVNI